MASLNMHQKRARMCLAQALVMVKDGYLAENECPGVEDYEGLDVATLAIEYKDAKEESMNDGRIAKIYRVLTKE